MICCLSFMGSDLFSSVVRASIPAIVAIFMIVCAKMLPARKADPAFRKLSPKALSERFMPLRRRIIAGWFSVAVVFFFGSWFVLSSMNRLLAWIDGPVAFRLFPEPAMWWVFPCIGALTLSWELTLQIWARFSGRDTVNLFVQWSNSDSSFWGRQKFGPVDYRRIFRLMALIFAMPAGIGIFLGVGMHASIGTDTIRDCGYGFRPCRVYSLADARRITQIEGFRDNSGKLINRAGVVIDFKDGRRWFSGKWGDWSQFVDPALASYIEARTRLPLHFALTEKDIPPISEQAQPE
jgi:hypothetical protein